MRLIFLIWLGAWQTWVSAEPLAVAYRCDGISIFSGPFVPNDGWLPSADGVVPMDPQDRPCWIRIAGLPRGTSLDTAAGLSFGDLNVQRVDITLYDAHGRTLGQALRLGQSSAAMVTGLRATFTPDSMAAMPLYVQFQPVKGALNFPGVVRKLQVETVAPAISLRHEQGRDLLNQSAAMFLVTTALMALFFFFTMRDLNYGIYALYASLQAFTFFVKRGLPYVLEVSSVLWLNAGVFTNLVAVLSVLLSVRFGNFKVHSPRTAVLAYGVAAAFLLLIPLHYLAPAWGGLVILGLLPLHFWVLLSGNFRGWRRGERGCGILLLGIAPIAVYWLAFLLYTQVLRQPLPSGLAFGGSAFDFVRTLLLPIVFCYGLADRTVGLQRKVERLARFDSLTELRNREGMCQRGQSMIDGGARPCLLMLNVERFHAINETLGPELGDQVLKETGKRLFLVCKGHPNARVGRMHVDQFCILLPNLHALQAMHEEIEKAFSLPAEIEGQAIDISLAVGVAKPWDTGMSMVQLLRNAEIALEAGRAKHKNWLEYRVDLESSKRVDLDLLSELKRAVEHNELRMYLQPKVRLLDGAVSSAEALVRWMHPKRGLIPPGDFVPFAEKTGGVTLLTRWVLKEAMHVVTRSRAQGRPLQISVNLSTFDLAEAGFADRVAALALDTGAEPADIRLEITESGAMQDPAAALEVMNALREAGFSLSIDDFGTGYSSLAYLQKMPVAELKIDRSFVRNVKAGSDGASLLDSTIALGHRLGLIVVAEGAEDAQEWELLRSLGCDYAQGWYAAKAMPLGDFELWCRERVPFFA